MITKTTGDRGLLKPSFLLPNAIKTPHSKTTFKNKKEVFPPHLYTLPPFLSQALFYFLRTA